MLRLTVAEGYEMETKVKSFEVRVSNPVGAGNTCIANFNDKMTSKEISDALFQLWQRFQGSVAQTHDLYTEDDFTGKEKEENKIYMWVSNGLAICKKCGRAESDLDNSCSDPL